MSDDLKHLIDFGAVSTSIGTLIGLLMEAMPRITAGLSSLLALFWLALRIHGELVDRGYIKGRTKRTRRED